MQTSSLLLINKKLKRKHDANIIKTESESELLTVY